MSRSLSLPWVTLFWFAIVLDPVSVLRVCDLVLRLAGWRLIKNNNNKTKKKRACVFVGLFAEEIPTVLSVSGLCVFSRLHA